MQGLVASLGDTIGNSYDALDCLGALAFGVADLLLWRKYGFWVPRYVHALAAAALGLILWLNWMWLRAGGELTVRRGIIIVLFPLLVYFIFVSYGGVQAAAGERDRRDRVKT